MFDCDRFQQQLSMLCPMGHFRCHIGLIMGSFFPHLLEYELLESVKFAIDKKLSHSTKKLLNLIKLGANNLVYCSTVQDTQLRT